MFNANYMVLNVADHEVMKIHMHVGITGTLYVLKWRFRIVAMHAKLKHAVVAIHTMPYSLSMLLLPYMQCHTT